MLNMCHDRVDLKKTPLVLSSEQVKCIFFLEFTITEISHFTLSFLLRYSFLLYQVASFMGEIFIETL